MKRISSFLIAVALIVGMVGCGNGGEETDQPITFTDGDNDGKLSFRVATYLGGQHTAIERMTIDALGQVNINTLPTSPVGLVSGDIWYNPALQNSICYVP